MTTYATAAFYDRWKSHVGMKPVTLVKVELTDPTARTLRMASREVVVPDGNVWEPLVEVGGVIEADCEVLAEGPRLSTARMTLKNRKPGYIADPQATLTQAFIDYEWQGARITIWLWEETLTAFSDALQVFDGTITYYKGTRLRAEIGAKQDTKWNGDIPDKKVTTRTAPGAPEGSIDGYIPIVIGDRRAEPFSTPPFPNLYGNERELLDKGGGGTLVNPGIVLDTGRSGGKVRVAFSSQPMAQFVLSQGARPFLRGGDVLAAIDTNAGLTVFNDANGAGFTVDPGALRGWAAIIPIDVRAGVSTAQGGINACDVFNPETFALLDEASGTGTLQLVLPNLGSLGSFNSVSMVVGYSTESDQLICAYFNQGSNGPYLGAPTALPKTIVGVPTLETAAAVVGPWILQTGPPDNGAQVQVGGDWAFGGNGGTFIKDFRIGFANPAANNRARIYWAVLHAYFVPTLNVIVPGVEARPAGVQRDVSGRTVSGRPRGGTVTFGDKGAAGVRGISELLADIFANGQGPTDDASGTFTGIPSWLMELACDVGQWILYTFGAVPLGSIERSAGVFGSFVDARTNHLTLDSYPWRVATVLNSRGQVEDALSSLARETLAFWFINRFTSRHNWVPWDPAPVVVSYDRTLEKDDLLGIDEFEYEKPSDAFIVNRVTVRYGWDAARARHLHRASLVANESVGGYAQANARDQALVVAAGVNDKLDWREEYFESVSFGGSAGNNTIQVANSALYEVGQTIMDRLTYGNESAVFFPLGTTITGKPDGTHLQLSNNLIINVTYPNGVCRIARIRTATLAAGNYTGVSLAQEARTKMKAQSTSLDIKVDYGSWLIDEYNNYMTVVQNGTTYHIEFVAGFYPTMAALAAEIKRGLIAATGVATWAVTCAPRLSYLDYSIFAISCPTPFNIQWTHATTAAKSCAGAIGHRCNADTGLLSVTAGSPRRGETYCFGRASFNFALLPRTGPNRATTAWGLFGFRTTEDTNGGVTGPGIPLYVAPFRRGTRENVAAASVAAHGSKLPFEVSAGWINRNELATSLRDGHLEWRAEQRLTIRFPTLRFPDLERAMVFKTGASIDQVMKFPRKGSNGSWADRLWRALKVRQYIGPERWHQEVEAVECGNVGGFAPVASPTAPTALAAFLAWKDNRSVTQIYLGLLNAATGTLSVPNGAQIGASTETFSNPYLDMCPDGSGGCFVAFSENRSGTVNPFNVYVQRFTSAGAVAAGWPVGGVAVRTGQTGYASRVRIVQDGTGGVLLAWSDERAGSSNVTVYAQRVSGAGVPAWTANGVNCKTPSAFTGIGHISISSDGAGGGYVAWSTTSASAFVQRLSAAGAVQYGATAVAVGTTGTSGRCISVVAVPPVTAPVTTRVLSMDDGVGAPVQITVQASTPMIQRAQDASAAMIAAFSNTGYKCVWGFRIVAGFNDRITHKFYLDASAGRASASYQNVGWSIPTGDYASGAALATAMTTAAQAAENARTSSGSGDPGGARATITWTYNSGTGKFTQSYVYIMSTGTSECTIYAGSDPYTQSGLPVIGFHMAAAPTGSGASGSITGPNVVRYQQFVFAYSGSLAKLRMADASFTGEDIFGITDTTNQTIANYLCATAMPDTAAAGGCFVLTAGASTLLRKLDGAGATAAGWSGGGLALTTTGSSTDLDMIGDGVGGVIAAFYDGRDASKPRPFAQRVTDAGAQLWTAGGIPVAVPATNITGLAGIRLVRDGAGGATVVWSARPTGTTFNVYLQRISDLGVRLWPADVSVDNAPTGDQTEPAIAPDGVGGYYVFWTDQRGVDADLYVQHVDQNGLTSWLAPGGSGSPVVFVTGHQTQPAITTAAG